MKVKNKILSVLAGCGIAICLSLATAGPASASTFLWYRTGWDLTTTPSSSGCHSANGAFEKTRGFWGPITINRSWYPAKRPFDLDCNYVHSALANLLQPAKTAGIACWVHGGVMNGWDDIWDVVFLRDSAGNPYFGYVADIYVNEWSPSIAGECGVA